MSAGSITLPSTSATFASTVTVNSGATLTMSAGTSTFNSTLNINAGSTMNANSGIVELGGSGASIFCGNKTFNLVIFTHTTGSWWVRSDCSLPLGNDPVINNDVSIELDGTLSGSGTFTMTPGSLTFNSATASLSGFSGLDINVLNVLDGTIDFSSYTEWTVGTYGQSGGTVTLPTAGATITGDTTILAGTFIASSGTTSFNGNLTIDLASTFDANGGIVDFGGATGGALFCGDKTFNLVTFTHTAGYKSVYNDCTLPLGANPIAGAGGSINLGNNSPTLYGTGTLTTTGELLMYSSDLSGFSGLHTDDLTIYSANLGSYTTLDIDGNLIVYDDLTAPTGSMTIGGDVTFYGTFAHNNGTVILDGTDQTIDTDGSPITTFNNLTKIVTSPATLTFPAGDSIITEGTLTLKGTDASNLLTLASSTPGGTNWEIDAQGTRDIRYVSVADSTNLDSASLITAYDSVDGGDNIYWLFDDAPIPPDPPTPPAPTPIPTPTPDTTPTSVTRPILLSYLPLNTVDTGFYPAPNERSTVDTTTPNNRPFEQNQQPDKKTEWNWLLFGGFWLLLLIIFFLILFAKRRKKRDEQEQNTV